eukprot:187410_1
MSTTNNSSQNEEILFCHIERLKQKQIIVHERISQFSDRIKQAIKDSNDKLIPTNIADMIFSFSNHKYFNDLWLNVFRTLGQFSFMMKEGCKIEEIQQFEKKCKILLDDEQYELPDDIRISLMICNGIGLPTIFDDVHYMNLENKYYCGNPTIGAMAPLNTWDVEEDQVWDCMVKRSEEQFTEFSDTDWEDEAVRMKMGFCGNDIHKFNAKGIYWNIETNEIMLTECACSQWDDDGCYKFEYESFEEFLKVFSQYKKEEAMAFYTKERLSCNWFVDADGNNIDWTDDDLKSKLATMTCYEWNEDVFEILVAMYGLKTIQKPAADKGNKKRMIQHDHYSDDGAQRPSKRQKR